SGGEEEREPAGHNDGNLTCRINCAGTDLEFLHRRPWGLVRLVGQFKEASPSLRVNHGEPYIQADNSSSQPQRRLKTVEGLLLTEKNVQYRESLEEFR
ncbi:hypothetical protein XENOCAPTIV_022698, partial [Xenoophorus captivus]